MRVLVIGSGGREAAIAYALNKSSKVDELYCLPGNPGMGEIATLINGSVEDLDFILKTVEDLKIDFTVIGPEVPLCMGLADLLESHGHKVFGPTKVAATLEGSKAFSKDFMKRHNIPTAEYVEVDEYEKAVESLKNFTYPLVIKADGLAAGKGVVICEDEETALKTLKEFMLDKTLNNAGSKLVIEEFLKGFECSLLCFTDGETIIPMPTVKDHKQIYDNNKGPNTGGMGTVSPNPFMPDFSKEMLDSILIPFINGLKEDNMDYRGVIFIGLMIKDNKAKVLEFNVRFGDPETQSIMLRLESDLFDIMYATSTKNLKDISVKWNDDTVCTLVLASGGYPGSYPKGLEIKNLDKLDDDIIVFHAGTKIVDNKLLTNGGRVLNICAKGNNLQEARAKVYKAAEVIDFEGKYYRKDIGLN
ncbi:MAG: phosphoribosylamine--glycine ligase [Solobacterium sp.]|nr:phosphoribosylamine--glycine ligase [Solobacterium sp.]MDY2952582.1 phosphoribosylamine--glycine ligase [Erysipelotrichaceae bacterium]MCI6846432.1 phosphoribosylamine--glycine ligase [Solobacterium sp.]MDD7776806.1 phosphoribosylamine--glycine ligase [Solobacterium sp.]MDY4791128.1 phosphoribosylamine--glycine ligase [Erysipelotrichaceae bacterium]